MKGLYRKWQKQSVVLKEKSFTLETEVPNRLPVGTMPPIDTFPGAHQGPSTLGTLSNLSALKSLSLASYNYCGITVRMCNPLFKV